MKKISHFLIFSLITFFCAAQETSTIKVNGRAIHIANELNFEGAVSLSTYSSSPTEAISLSQMKVKYNEVLKKNGLSITDLKEDPIGYLYLGHDKEGVLYHFKTPSLDKFNSFLTSKTFGLQHLNYEYSIMLSEKEVSLLASKAIKNANEKAQIIVKSANKELGNIVHIEDNNHIFNDGLKHHSLYYDSNIGQYIYQITVTFELKDN
jgi:hypothetical protein